VIWLAVVYLMTVFQLCELIESVLNDRIGGVVAHMNAVSQLFVGRTEENASCQY
jgi:uncharacterized membrane protein